MFANMHNPGSSASNMYLSQKGMQQPGSPSCGRPRARAAGAAQPGMFANMHAPGSSASTIYLGLEKKECGSQGARAAAGPMQGLPVQHRLACLQTCTVLAAARLKCAG